MEKATGVKASESVAPDAAKLEEEGEGWKSIAEDLRAEGVLRNAERSGGAPEPACKEDKEGGASRWGAAGE